MQGFNLYKWLFPFVARTTPAVISVTDVILPGLLRTHSGRRNVRIVQNGVDLDSPALAPSVDEVQAVRNLLEQTGCAGPIIGTVANFHQVKGLSLLVEAYRTIAAADPRSMLVMVGGGPLLKPLSEAIARDPILSSRVQCPGYVGNPYPYIANFDLFVLPSLAEGFPNVLLEAMTLGKPVVATRVGAVPDIVEDGKTGLVVAPGEPASLAHAIRSMLDDVSTMHEMGRKARSRVESRFSVQTSVAQTEAVFREVISRLN